MRQNILDISLRLGVGIISLIAGISKLPMHEKWVEIVTAYRILPLPLAQLYASALPWLEITIGACLILGLSIRVFSLVSIPIIISFIVANVSALSRGFSGGCGCGGSISASYETALIIDALLLIGAVLIFLQRRHFMTLDSRLNSFILLR